MALDTWIGFWTVSFLFVITPGADWAYAISAGMRNRSAVPAVGGLASGHLIATGIVAGGVAVLLARVPAVLTVLTGVGGAYLVWLGVMTVRASRGAAVVSAGLEVAGSRWSQAWKGLAISGLNPKVFLLFLALLPRFVDERSSWSVPAQTLLLGLTHVVSCLVVYSVIAVCARRVLRSRPTAARTVTALSGGAMVVIGSVLVLEQVFV